MKFAITTCLVIAFPVMVFAQNFCTTGGAQGGSLGVSDCNPYQAPCPDSSDAQILLILHTDSLASENSWKMTDMTDSITIAEGDILANDTLYQHMICAYKDHCYQFTISDTAGNGIDSTFGGYSLYWNGDLLISGSDFGIKDSISFGACCTNFSVELLGGIPCLNYNEGEVRVEKYGGTAPFDYLWSNGATFTEIQYVTPNDGQISITVTDASNCIAVDTFQTANLQALDFIVESSSGSPCDTTSTGVASVSLISGIPPFSYTWSSGGTNKSESNLTPGTYYITVSDATNCVRTDSVTITKPPILEAETSVTDVQCSGDSNGSINLSVSGGTLPYSYLWSNGATTEDLNELPGGDYSVVISDGEQCILDTTVIVNNPDPIVIEVDSVFSETLDNKDGAIQITVAGGTGSSYDYKWYLNFNLISEDEDPSGLSAGTYTLIVTDSNACPATINVDVNSTGINYQGLLNSISLIPNPTIGLVVLDLNFQQYHKIQIAIVDNLGEAIITTTPKEIQSNSFEFDLSNYSPGLYFVNISIDGRIVTKQLLLSK